MTVQETYSRAYGEGYQSALRDVARVLENSGVEGVAAWIADNTPLDSTDERI